MPSSDKIYVQPTRTHCPFDHALTSENLKWHKNSTTGRYYSYCRTCSLREQKVARQKMHGTLKQETMLQYGNGTCACCGEHHISMLTLDHVEDDGAEHRAFIKMNGAGFRFYRHLKALGWPTEPPLQVLCFNCNQAKHIEGVCPHAAE